MTTRHREGDTAIRNVIVTFVTCIGFLTLAHPVDAFERTMKYPSSAIYLAGRGNEGMDDEQWLAIADDTWRRATAESHPFRRQALIEEAAAAIVRGTTRAVRAHCLAQTGGDRARADDLAQQTFLTLWRTLPRFEGRSSLKTFVLGIAHNICRDALRAGARASARAERDDEQLSRELEAELSPRPDEALVQQERAKALRTALAKLDARDTWLLWARLVDQQNYADMLPAYRKEFGAHIATEEGLRTALFHAKRRLLAVLERGAE